MKSFNEVPTTGQGRLKYGIAAADTVLVEGENLDLQKLGIGLKGIRYNLKLVVKQVSNDNCCKSAHDLIEYVFLLFSTYFYVSFLFTFLVEKTCGPEEWACKSKPGDCIPKAWVCDGHEDCDDKSDENFCSKCKKSFQSIFSMIYRLYAFDNKFKLLRNILFYRR